MDWTKSWENENQSTYIFEENDCVLKKQKKYETIMCLGNGYIGMRSAFCEEHESQSRLTLIAGLYDQQPSEIEELMPLPDVSVMNIAINKEEIGPMGNGASKYHRELNLKNGLLTYSYDYAPQNESNMVSVVHRRFVSMENIHMVVFETKMCVAKACDISFGATVNARQTVNGTQHTFEEERTVLERDLLWYGGRASVAGTPFRTGLRMKVFVNGIEQNRIQHYGTGRRQLSSNVCLRLTPDDELCVVRYALYYTANDVEWGERSAEAIRAYIQAEMDRVSACDFDTLLAKSQAMWKKRWNRCDIKIDCSDPEESLKVRMALYHSIIMCPSHDNRSSIAAKGLSGMGYAGHVFWDCELFNLPFFAYTDPEAARNLCTYRYYTLNGARSKAREYGYRGAMYPWESASMRGEEQCPTFGIYYPDNTRRHIICGEIEHHVTCDVAYGIYHYVQTTEDIDFWKRYGLEILFETADFWQSRLNYNSQEDRYEILQVTGPDEYKEYVDNDVFTNYMVAWNLQTALEEAEKLRESDPMSFERFEHSIGLVRLMQEIRKKRPKLYLPVANDEGLIPQNDTYLSLQQIDLTKYKTSGINRLICRDYSLEHISKLMVSKQADLIQLFTLMPTFFPIATVKRNFDFYESKCLHDSSLSLSAYATVAVKVLRDADFAHEFFKRALNTDFGRESTQSNDGIHAANCGGIWQTVALGFAGITAGKDVLYIEPILPSAWNEFTLHLFWRGCELKITTNRQQVIVESLNGAEIEIDLYGQRKLLEQAVTVAYKE